MENVNVEENWMKVLVKFDSHYSKQRNCLDDGLQKNHFNKFKELLGRIL